MPPTPDSTPDAKVAPIPPAHPTSQPLSYQPVSWLENCHAARCYRATDGQGGWFELRQLDENWLDRSSAAGWRARIARAALLRLPGSQTVVHTALDERPAFVVLEERLPQRLADVPPVEQYTGPQFVAKTLPLVEALVAAHRLGIVHGCLGPNQILVRPDDSWMIDFTGILAADPDAPPESDVYGLGVTLAGLWRGELPPADASPEEMVAWIERPNDGASAGAVKGDDRDTARIDLLRICLAADPDHRPSMVEFAHRWRGLSTSADSGDNLTSPKKLFDSTSPQVEANALLRAPLAPPVAVPAKVSPPTPPQDAAGSLPFEATWMGGVPGTPPGLSAAASTPLAAIPRRLGRFELLDVLGEGGMGTVYRARDLADQQLVAVKLLRGGALVNDSVRRRFAKEARMLARLNNPYLANLIEFHDEAGIAYLVVEFVPGGTLGELLRPGTPLPEPLVLRLFVDIARGLETAHQRGIVHRDIKPDNVLLTNHGRAVVAAMLGGAADQAATAPVDLAADTTPLVKLADFGLARAQQNSESLAITQDGTLLGTPAYMSPEQCLGRAVGAWSDIYALGATLFHVLTGRPPFVGESPFEVIQKHCDEAPPSIGPLRPEISEGLAVIVDKCLAKNPEVRYADASALRAELERLLRGEATSLTLHPRTPITAGEVLEFRFECDLQASPSALWPYISNTDRVNHALGLPTVRYTTRVDTERGVVRTAESRIAGQQLVWEEHPYEWLEGRRMSVLREFRSGPFDWFVNVVELLPQSGGGTRVVQTLKAAPRGTLGRWLARWQLGHRSPRAFRKVYQHIDNYLARESLRQPQADAWGSSRTLATSRRAQLRSRAERLAPQGIDPLVLETLTQFLEHASDLEVARIRPLAFAERFELDARQLVQACLLGAKEGLLVLLWDILCPSCRIPADVQETLQALRDHSYCPACDLRYEVDFAQSVELIFRVHPELRPVETRTYCIGGPAFSAHVVAQSRLEPGERLDWDLALGEGDYQIRGPQLPFVVALPVAQRQTLRRWELPLLRPPRPGDVPILAAGNQVVTLWNNTPRELLVRLERTASRRTALTAAAAQALPLFREMFPDQTLSPGQMMSVTRVTLLLVDFVDGASLYRENNDGAAFVQIRELFSACEEVLHREGGALQKSDAQGFVATFSDTLSAVRAALPIAAIRSSAAALSLRVAVHAGPAVVATVHDRLDYFGRTVHAAHALLRHAGPGEVLLSDDVATQADVASYWQQQPGPSDIMALGDDMPIARAHRRRVDSQA